MTRARAAVLAGVLVLLAGALLLGTRDAQPDARAAPGLGALREAAALDPCPDAVGAQLPDLVLPCVGSPGEVALRGEGTGRPTLVNLWATWCGPCVREVPLLQALHERTDAVDVVGVLTQDTARNALRFAEDPTLGFDMTYPSLQDDAGALLRRYGSGPPVTLFVTGDGDVAHVERGEIRSEDELAGLLDRHLGVRL